ncbi:MAG: SDR family NAD(P)-dependent oxidoreductase [Promethearchaeota archaeon]
MTKNFLEGKGALITGGASGFGKGVGLELAQKGADIILVDINEESLEKTSKDIESKTKRKVIPIICDVSDVKQVKQLAEQTYKEVDNVFILFNNAGICPAAGKNILRVKERDWDIILNVNLKGQWLVGKTFGPKIRRQDFDPISGKIIHTASIAGINVDSFIPIYSISKVGIIALMELLAKELAPRVTVNAISPGYHVTGIYANDEDLMKDTMDMGHVKTPLNRYGTVEDVVRLVNFLASPSSDFITGHNFPIDGGIVDIGVPAWYLKSDI